MRNWYGNVAISQNGFISGIGKKVNLSDEVDWKFVHQQLRNKSAGIVVGSETVIVDDPSLLPKQKYLDEGEILHHPVRIIFDRRGRVNNSHKVFSISESPTIWVSNSSKKYLNVIKLPYTSLSTAVEGINHELETLNYKGDVLVEGGSRLLISLINEGIIKELRVFRSPVIIEKGVTLFTDDLRRKKDLNKSREFGNGIEEHYLFSS